MDEEARKRIDAALQSWRQGDCVVEETWFLFRLDVDTPLTDEAVEAAAENLDTAEAQAPGFMVVTQTCDIVRSCADRPFIELCPLVEVPPTQMRQIERHRRPAYAYVPGVAHRNLVADLDRVMTAEKAVLAKWTRTQGCLTDDDVRQLAMALGRKRKRAAFPDDFVELARPLVERLRSKHDKESDEGRALRALREIRIRAAPSWDADSINLTFFFICDDEAAPGPKDWFEYLEDWLGLLAPSGRFMAIDGIAQSLDDLSARDYVESDLLDLDHLTLRRPY